MTPPKNDTPKQPWNRPHSQKWENRPMRSKRMILAVVTCLVLTAGCNLLTPLIFVGEHKKKVSPEFDKLANSRVAVLIWTDQVVLYDYPYARFELGTYVSDKLAAEMNQRGLATDLVDPRDVDDYLQKDIDAQIDPKAVARKFDTDYVIYVEVVEFQIRDPAEPQFLRGRINASVTVFDTHADPDRPNRFELAPVLCRYPEGVPVLLNATNSPLVREQLYRKFAEQVARKFYEHTVEL
jgi:hypothetical protein